MFGQACSMLAKLARSLPCQSSYAGTIAARGHTHALERGLSALALPTIGAITQSSAMRTAYYRVWGVIAVPPLAGDAAVVDGTPKLSLSLNSNSVKAHKLSLNTHVAAPCAWRYVGTTTGSMSPRDRRQPCTLRSYRSEIQQQRVGRHGRRRKVGAALSTTRRFAALAG
jgi:hypothetical protein